MPFLSNNQKTGQLLRSNLVFGWGGGISESLRSLDCFRQPKILRLRLGFSGRQGRTRCALILTKIKNRPILKDESVFWLGRRDSDPRDAGGKVLCLTAWRRPNMLIVKTPTAFNYGRINFKWGGGWDSNPRSSEPQSDALGQLRYIHHIGS